MLKSWDGIKGLWHSITRPAPAEARLWVVYAPREGVLKPLSVPFETATDNVNERIDLEIAQREGKLEYKGEIRWCRFYDAATEHEALEQAAKFGLGFLHPDTLNRRRRDVAQKKQDAYKRNPREHFLIYRVTAEAKPRVLRVPASADAILAMRLLAEQEHTPFGSVAYFRSAADTPQKAVALALEDKLEYIAPGVMLALRDRYPREPMARLRALYRDGLQAELATFERLAKALEAGQPRPS